VSASLETPAAPRGAHPSVIWPLARLLAPHIPGAAALAYDELVRGIEVERVAEATLSQEGTEGAA